MNREQKMGAYHNLSEKLQQRIIEDRKEHRANPYAFSEEQVLGESLEASLCPGH